MKVQTGVFGVPPNAGSTHSPHNPESRRNTVLFLGDLRAIPITGRDTPELAKLLPKKWVRWGIPTLLDRPQGVPASATSRPMIIPTPVSMAFISGSGLSTIVSACPECPAFAGTGRRGFLAAEDGYRESLNSLLRDLKRWGGRRHHCFAVGDGALRFCAAARDAWPNRPRAASLVQRQFPRQAADAALGKGQANRTGSPGHPGLGHTTWLPRPSGAESAW